MLLVFCLGLMFGPRLEIKASGYRALTSLTS